MKLTIGRKLGLGFGLIVALLITQAASSFYYSNRGDETLHEITEETEALAATLELDANFGEALIGVFAYTALEEQAGLGEYEEALVEAEENLQIVLANAEEDGGDEMDRMPELLADKDTYFAQLASVLDSYRRNPADIDGLHADLAEVTGFADEHITPHIHAIGEAAEAEIILLGAEADASAEAAIRVSLVLGVIATLIAVAAAYLIGRGITGSAAHLSEAAEAISRGDMDAPISVTTGDEMETLAKAVERMRASLKAAIERLR